jgi:tetratricopeptide (TPR) repeat protein
MLIMCSKRNNSKSYIPNEPKNFKQSINCEYLLQQGLTHHQKGQLKEAQKIYKQILKNDPRNFEALQLNGTLNLQQKKYKTALKFFNLALKINPRVPYVNYNLGNVLHNLERFDDALQSYDRAIQLKPDYAEAFYNRGVVLEHLQRFDEALQSIDRAIQLKPDYAEPFNNRGNALIGLKRFDEALQSIDRAIQLKPDFAEAFSNLGILLEYLHRFDDALQSYDRAIQLKPNYAEAYFNQSIIKLRLGKYEEGWRLYEYRQVKKDTKNNYKKFPIPLWLGNESIDNKVILILNEQGLGDSIQFCRYLLMLASLNPKEIIFMVQKPLLSLFSNFNKKIKILEQDKPLPHFDYYSPLMSLPLAFKTTLGTIPVNIPYLTVDDVKNKYWQDRFGKQTKAKIGLVWSGSTTHKKDRYRSLALRQLVLLLELPFEFHSLQKEIRSDDKKILKTCKSLYQHQNDLNDFSDTAALLNQMDLIISIDTSVVHLAGALDKQVWVLLPYIPDFRWLLNRDNSPWYPSIRLFRQPKFDDWESVIQQLIIELKKLYIK